MLKENKVPMQLLVMLPKPRALKANWVNRKLLLKTQELQLKLCK